MRLVCINCFRIKQIQNTQDPQIISRMFSNIKENSGPLEPVKRHPKLRIGIRYKSCEDFSSQSEEYSAQTDPLHASTRKYYQSPYLEPTFTKLSDSSVVKGISTIAKCACCEDPDEVPRGIKSRPRVLNSRPRVLYNLCMGRLTDLESKTTHYGNVD
jgi:hypothetical protein